MDDNKDYEYWFVKSKSMSRTKDGAIQTTFRLPKDQGDKEHAKEYVIRTYGDKPFVRPKATINIEDDIEYYYLAKSDEYWYNFHNRVFHEVCENCQKEFDRVGDTARSRLWYVRGKPICSYDCHCEYNHKLELERECIDNDRYFINESDHVHIDCENNFDLCGYVYMITNKATMTSYVGKTIKPPLFRWWQHLKVDGKFDGAKLTELVFQVLEIVYASSQNSSKKENEDKLAQRERYFIDQFDLVENGYNKI